MMRMWQRVLAFTAQREPATSLALCRIVACTTLALHVLHMLVNGAVTFTWTDASLGGLGAHKLAGVVDASEGTVLALAWLCAGAAICGALGWFTRPALVVAWASFRALYEVATDARSAYDILITNTLFVLILSGCGAALSLDARRDPAGATVARWPRMLLVLQIGLLYFGSALMKASSGWVPGGDASALWYILHQPMWARFGDLPSWLYVPTQIATTMTWCFEMCGPVFVASVLLREWSPSSSPSPTPSRVVRALARCKRVLDRVHFRELYLVVGVAMHLGIEVTMEVGAFTGASLALYACAVRPDEWRRVITYIPSAYSRIRSRR